MTGHPVRLGADGRLVTVRQSPPEDPDRLRHVARRLRAAAGAGAVDIVHVDDDGDRVELALAFAGRPLTSPMRAAALAPIFAALASHLSDLHLRGLVHGAVIAEHVLVDAGGAVRLCGFGQQGDMAPSVDVQAVGLLVRDVLDDADRSALADSLRLHAERCCADEAARPTMAAIAAALASIDGPARVTPAVARRQPRRPWRWAAVVSGALLAALVLAALPRASRAEPHRETSPARIITTTSTVPVTTSTSASPARVWPRSLEQDGATWTLGDIDDRTAVVDLDCDGVHTPVVLQLPERHVWVVGQWRDGATARFVTTVPGAIDVAATEECAVIVVRTEGGDVRLTLSA